MKKKITKKIKSRGKDSRRENAFSIESPRIREIRDSKISRNSRFFRGFAIQKRSNNENSNWRLFILLKKAKRGG